MKATKDRDLKSCQTIASDKSNFLIKAYSFLKIRFQVIAFLILIEVRYLVTIVVNFVYVCFVYFLERYKKLSDSFIFSGDFSY